MTHVDIAGFPRGPLEPGHAYDRINQFFGLLGQVRGANRIESKEAATSPELTPLEERLRLVQNAISAVSMHMPKGFAGGLNRQFANLMDDDAWEDEDELISLTAITAFIVTIICTRTKRRPGIGTNGRGSVTASWTSEKNRLTIECLPSGKASFTMSRENEAGEVERAAFGPISPQRIPEILEPFDPGVWFDG